MKRIAKLITLLIIFLLAFATGFGINIAIHKDDDGTPMIETNFTMHLSSSQHPALIEDETGNAEVDENIATVEEVEGNQIVDECKGTDECGKGRFINAPVDSFIHFKEFTLGKCWDVDEFYGGQCWDLAAMFWENYTKDGRVLSTCGTGAAKGAWTCKDLNAGDEFILIDNPKELQAGDWIIFSSGKYGHVGMALGSYNDGYITLLGQNQGGESCSGGGSATNIINISLKSFLGAFRPKSYIKPNPVIPTTGCTKWHVEEGDTMSGIMLECENTIIYGEPMNEYAKSWYSTVIRPGQSVYEGWSSPEGVGLYDEDDIEHRI